MGAHLEPKSVERVLTLYRNHRLHEHRPDLALQLQLLNVNNPSSLDHRVWQALQSEIEAMVSGYEEHPVLLAPPHLLPVGLVVARQVGDDAPIALRPDGHTVVLGPTGAGKTTLSVRALVAARAAGMHVKIYDVKNDTTFLPIIDPDFVVLDGDSRVNVLERPPFQSVAQHVANWTEWFVRSLYGGELQRQVLHDTLHKAFANHPAPCVDDLLTIINNASSPRDTYQRRDAIAGIKNRLARIKDEYPTPATTRCGVSLTTLADRSVYMDVASHTDVSEWLFTFFVVNQLFQYNRSRNHRNQQSHLVFLDESLFTFSTSHAQSKIGGMNPMAHLITMQREFSISSLITATTLTSTDPLVLRNASSIIILPGLSETNELGRTLGFTPELQRYINTKLATGECIAKFLGQWREPVHARFDPLPDELKTVNKTSTQWQAAKERLNNLLPQHPKPIERPALPAPTTKPAAQPSRLALNKNEERVVSYLAEHGIALVSDISTGLELHPMALDRARKKLETVYKFVESGRVKTGRGRGKAGIALRLTAIAYNWLGKRAHGMRGHSGIQHHYWCNTIARALGGNLETTVGDKSVDIALNNDPTKHDGFLELVVATAHRLTDEFATVRASDVIAIEVESDGTRTALNNAVKNHAAGIPLTIIAVHESLLPTYAALKELDPEVWPHTVLVDVLWLLDTVREAT